MSYTLSLTRAVPCDGHCSPWTWQSWTGLHTRQRCARDASHPHLWGWGRSHTRHVQHRQGICAVISTKLKKLMNDILCTRSMVENLRYDLRYCTPMHSCYYLYTVYRVSQTLHTAPSSMLSRKAGLSTWGNYIRGCTYTMCRMHKWGVCGI